MMRKVVFVCSAAVLLFAAALPILDFQQCDRKCRWQYSDGKAAPFGSNSSVLDDFTIYGRRNWLTNPAKCTCYSTATGKKIGNVDRLYQPFKAGYPYPSENTRVCGLDGIEYADAPAAAAAGTKVINCGPCGSCSNVHDVGLYRKYSEPMSRMLARCAVLYMFLGGSSLASSVARRCLDSEFGFTDACTERFVDNYGCILAHCYEECVYKWDNVLSRSPNREGTRLSPCLLCDEMHCSPKFIETAGANRRCSGTLTDIKRPEEEVCSHVNAIE